MAKSKVFWLTRDECSDSHYEIWPYREHPRNDENGIYPSGAEFSCYCDSFEEFTGITLAPGQRVKARLVIKE